MMESPHKLHLDIAEAGKALALNGRHAEALEKYREAMTIARQARAPQLFGRHYLHCILDSLEKMGAHDRAAELAAQAAAAVAEAGSSDFQRRDRAHLLERAGVNRLKQGDVAAGRAALAEALTLDPGLKLAGQLLDWTARGLAVNAARFAEAQRRHRYWVVEREAVHG